MVDVEDCGEGCSNTRSFRKAMKTTDFGNCWLSKSRTNQKHVLCKESTRKDGSHEKKKKKIVHSQLERSCFPLLSMLRFSYKKKQKNRSLSDI